MPNSNIVINNKAIDFNFFFFNYQIIFYCFVSFWCLNRKTFRSYPDRPTVFMNTCFALNSNVLGEIEYDKNGFIIIVHIVVYKHISERNLY